MPADTAGSSSLGVPQLQRELEELKKELLVRMEAESFALQREEAFAEILSAINDPEADLTRVFSVMIERATKLCSAAYGYIWLYDGERARPAASFAQQPFGEWLRQRESVPNEITPLGKALLHHRLIHVVDATAHEGYLRHAGFRELVDRGGVRTLLHVPLCKGENLLGVITVYRQERHPFSDRQIALMQGFAAQAVIAMENARLLNEQREALEQQTATAEVLRVINASPGQLEPVFNVMLEKAMALCRAAFGFLTNYDGQRFSPAAMRGVPPSLAEYFARGMDQPNPGEAHYRILQGEDVIHNLDQKDEEAYRAGLPLRRAVVDLGGARSALVVALRKDGAVLGAFTIYRKEVRPFSEKEIELMRNFAAQAVIAIENARLMSETRDALERQTATADILKIIASSPTDVQPVLDALVTAAVRFCGATDATISLRVGDEIVRKAHHGPLGAKIGEHRPINGDSASARAIRSGRTVHYQDILALDPVEFGGAHRRATHDGYRAALAAPMVRDGVAIGNIALRKVDAGAFTPEQIGLLETFAAQAVIAIENVRLFNDLREALEQQTATSDILRVISQSPTDVTPVLTAVAKAALKFCGASDAQVALRDGDAWSVVAHEGPIGALSGKRRLNRETAPGRAMVDGEVVQIPDLQSAEADEFQEARELGRRLGFRSALAAPLLRDGVPIGAISLRRPEAGAFTPNQVELLKSFAAQAVIAIENVRLFNDLREALEQQTATAEVLRVISQSPTDVAPVLTAVVGAARRFCGADDAMIVLRRDQDQLLSTHEGSMPALVGTTIPLDVSSTTGRACLEGRTIHVPDVRALDAAEHAMTIELASKTNARALLAAPMLRDGIAVGSVLLRKPEPVPFTPRQVTLLETFAAQAVIAIENVRLFTELRESLDRLTAAQANLIQAEKMASLGQLTAGIAHEIKNPLNFINNFAGLSSELLDELKQAVTALLDEPDDEKRAELQETMDLLTGNLARIVEHGKRADGIVKSMLSHSRGGTGDWQKSNINALVEEALNLAYHGARAQDKDFNITLTRDLAPEMNVIEVVPQDITRVFLNLFGNAFYATRKRGLSRADTGYRPTLSVSTRDLGEAVEIRVRDNGTGIQPEVRAKLFQPFFTTKPTGEGTGLGLSISYDIVTQQHGGMVEVESEAGSFTEFIVRLPRNRRPAQSRATA